jgi:hypothetical protein
MLLLSDFELQKMLSVSAIGNVSGEVDELDVGRSAAAAARRDPLPVAPLTQLEILETIVRAIAVEVVHSLAAFKGASKMSCHNEAMLHDIAGRRCVPRGLGG